MRSSAIGFFAAEALLLVDVALYAAAVSVWAALGWVGVMYLTWEAYKWLNA
jgi:threonine/homoserine/homoserine lactone efflux protein